MTGKGTHADHPSLLGHTPTPSRFAQRTWLFDLDNTLHNADPHIFPRINRAMTAYICEHMNMDDAQASLLRQVYWKRYGATLLGLMRDFGTDPHHFLHHTHPLEDLERMVIAERGLKAMLRRLPGRKIIFSNAPRKYVEAVLAISGIRRCFDAVYSVEQLRFQPKPAIGGFLRLLKNEGLDPRSCIMVEDTLHNLKTAKKLGMKTVWVSANSRQSPYVDVKLASVMELPQRLGRL